MKHSDSLVKKVQEAIFNLPPYESGTPWGVAVAMPVVLPAQIIASALEEAQGDSFPLSVVFSNYGEGGVDINFLRKVEFNITPVGEVVPVDFSWD